MTGLYSDEKSISIPFLQFPQNTAISTTRTQGLPLKFPPIPELGGELPLRLPDKVVASLENSIIFRASRWTLSYLPFSCPFHFLLPFFPFPLPTTWLFAPPRPHRSLPSLSSSSSSSSNAGRCRTGRPASSKTLSAGFGCVSVVPPRLV